MLFVTFREVRFVYRKLRNTAKEAQEYKRATFLQLDALLLWTFFGFLIFQFFPTEMKNGEDRLRGNNNNDNVDQSNDQQQHQQQQQQQPP